LLKGPEEASQPEIAQLQVPILCEKQVGDLDVPVHHPARVQERHALQQLLAPNAPCVTAFSESDSQASFVNKNWPRLCPMVDCYLTFAPYFPLAILVGWGESPVWDRAPPRVHLEMDSSYCEGQKLDCTALDRPIPDRGNSLMIGFVQDWPHQCPRGAF
jgi:hypothetical protein